MRFIRLTATSDAAKKTNQKEASFDKMAGGASFFRARMS
ncbi:hypothetical protein TGS27_2388 [Geobacillus stearothermophilus]|nr:hypothetical protein TGS27_2388 [Geobacillus stearothermophilus]